jgi:hypothetical protein
LPGLAAAGTGGGRKSMELKKGRGCRDAQEAVAKVLMAARDPTDGVPEAHVDAALAAVAAAAEARGGAAAGPAAPHPGGAAPPR